MRNMSTPGKIALDLPQKYENLILRLGEIINGI